MKTYQFYVVTALLVALVSMSAMTVFVRRYEPKPTYDYKIKLLTDSYLDVELGRLGDAGWQLVSARRAVDNGSAAYEAIFIRRQ